MLFINDDDLLSVLFPLPFTQTHPSDAPSPLAGVTYQSSEALVKLLKDNHVKWHIFFNDKGFHKYVLLVPTGDIDDDPLEAIPRITC